VVGAIHPRETGTQITHTGNQDKNTHLEAEDQGQGHPDQDGEDQNPLQGPGEEHFQNHLQGQDRGQIPSHHQDQNGGLVQSHHPGPGEKDLIQNHLQGLSERGLNQDHLKVTLKIRPLLRNHPQRNGTNTSPKSQRRKNPRNHPEKRMLCL